MPGKKIRIFAFGGNEVAPAGLRDSRGHDIIPDIAMQWQRTSETCLGVARIIAGHPDDGFILTHGNGPQVGNILLRAEYSRNILPPLPLDVCGADSQGAMGYMLSQLLGNHLRVLGIRKEVIAIVTRVVVDKNDPGFKNPSKFIGPSYTGEEAKERMTKDGWAMRPYRKNDRGDEIWRRVVPSPEPLDIVEMDMIESALRDGRIPIAAGGGGIPVVEAEKGQNGYTGNYGISYNAREKAGIYTGVEAVVDKDLASALLGALLIRRAALRGEDVDAALTIFTGEDGVKLNYQKKDQKDIRRMTLEEAERYYKQGEFPAGSMGPKVRAVINFLKSGGTEACISLTDKYEETQKGTAGTVIVKE